MGYLFHRNFKSVTNGLCRLKLISVISPLIGLLGTVWGMVDVFQGMSGIMRASGRTGGDAANSNALRQSALALIVDTIDANKSYPRQARQNGIEGTVVLCVTIGSDGRILTVDVRKKHASVLLNRAALKAADKLIGMRLEGIGPLEVDVPVVFDLQSRN